MEREWFQTWDRPEYLEWARPAGHERYDVLIIRSEHPEHRVLLCVKARLIFGNTGLPDLELIEEHKVNSMEQALQQIHDWGKTCVTNPY